MSGLRIAQLANFVGPTSGGMRTAIEHVGQGYIEAGAERIVITPGERDVVIETEFGTVVRMKAPKVGGGYRLITDPWKVIETLERFRPTTVEISDKSTLLPVARWARRNDIGSILFSHERLDAMLSLRTARPARLGGEGAQHRQSVAAGVGALYKILSRTYDAVVVTSRYAAAEFDEVTTPLVRIPLGVDLDTFHPSLAEPVDDGVLKLVHAGRLSREKSPHLAVATAPSCTAAASTCGWTCTAPARISTNCSRSPAPRRSCSTGTSTAARPSPATSPRPTSPCPSAPARPSAWPSSKPSPPALPSSRRTPAAPANSSTKPAAAGAQPTRRPGRRRTPTAELPGRRAAARHRAELYDWNTCIHHMLALHTRLAQSRLAA
jgi:alpha-1,6-mannosyltransferase